MPDPLANTGGVGKDLGGDLGGGLGGGKLKKTFRWILILASIIGIISALAIFYHILGLDLGFEVPIGVETLGILAGLAAFICGLDTLWNVFKKRSEI